MLDVGCNSGFIAFLVAAVGARRVEGVDVDSTLISKALRRLRWLKKRGYKTLPEEPMQKEGSDAGEKDWHQQQYTVSCVQGRGHVPYHAKPLKAGALQAAISNAKKMEKVLPAMPQSPRPEFPYNLEFRAENFHLSQLELKRKTSYDVVLLLKITQWIHMLYGDVAIQELFSKCHRLLRLGGILVLEAQPWQKYLEPKHQPPGRRGMHNTLILRPERFSELLGQQGFEKQVSVSPSGLTDAILVFRKVAQVQAESPPLMAQVFQEQQFLHPRVPKKGKVVPPRFPASTPEAPSQEAPVAPVEPALAAAELAPLMDEAAVAPPAPPEVEADSDLSPPSKRSRTEVGAVSEPPS